MKAILSPAMEVEYDFTIDLAGSTLRVGDPVDSGDFGLCFDGVGIIEAVSQTEKGITGYVKIYPRITL